MEGVVGGDEQGRLETVGRRACFVGRQRQLVLLAPLSVSSSEPSSSNVGTPPRAPSGT